MDEEKERPACASHADRQKEIQEKLESEGLDPDLSACGHAQAGEFDEGEQEELADLL